MFDSDIRVWGMRIDNFWSIFSVFPQEVKKIEKKKITNILLIS